MADRVTLNDVFDTDLGDYPVEGVEPKILPTERHLVADWCADDGWTTVPAGDEILTCKLCGSLVPDRSASLHLEWHRSLNPRDSGPTA